MDVLVSILECLRAAHKWLWPKIAHHLGFHIGNGSFISTYLRKYILLFLVMLFNNVKKTFYLSRFLLSLQMSILLGKTIKSPC